MNDYIKFFKEKIENDVEAAKDSALAVKEYMKSSTAYYHGKPVETLAIPKIFSLDAISYMQKAAETTYKIFEKIIDKYLSDASYRNLFPFPNDLEELVMIERNYDVKIPICRMDIFFNEEDFSFKFCEINTDGTSGMVEDLELNNALSYNEIFNEYKKEHELFSFELYDSFIEPFLYIYKDWSNDDKKPNVAIVDFLSDGYMADFEHFKESFEKAGCNCEICEITELKYEGGTLYSKNGYKIDAIYRRAVTTDIYSHLDEVNDFILAIKDKAVCCIGNFVTQIAHNKALFNIIRREETLSFLSDEEKEFVLKHFPQTGFLNEEGTCCEFSVEDVINTKDKWILKPLDLYGAREITAGKDVDDVTWEKKVRELLGKGYIFQEYCHPYETLNIDLLNDDVEFIKWINMTGIYVYSGKAAGFFSRLAPGSIIASHYGGKSLATLMQKD